LIAIFATMMLPLAVHGEDRYGSVLVDSAGALFADIDKLPTRGGGDSVNRAYFLYFNRNPLYYETRTVEFDCGAHTRKTIEVVEYNWDGSNRASATPSSSPLPAVYAGPLEEAGFEMACRPPPMFLKVFPFARTKAEIEAQWGVNIGQ
jgi:hypothetical protein